MPFTQRKKLLERNRTKKKKSKTAAAHSDITSGSFVSIWNGSSTTENRYQIICIKLEIYQ